RSEVAHAVRYVPDLQHESEIASYYQAADIAVSLASSDGTPVSVQEVMACATVTILGDIPAFHNWARHDQETLLVPLHDAEALSEAMVRLLRDKETSNRLAQNALTYVRANANRAAWMQRGEEIYAKVISDARHQAVAGTAAKPKQRR
ncbi:MAG: glycosyltransferase, partial [Chloroflexota bacterium]